jgi:hypothetical protein
MQSHLRCLWWIWIVFVLRVDAGAQRPPNFLFIVADDLGYGDLCTATIIFGSSLFSVGCQV